MLQNFPTAAELIPARLKQYAESEALAWEALRRAPRSRPQRDTWLELHAQLTLLQGLAVDLGLMSIDDFSIDIPARM